MVAFKDPSPDDILEMISCVMKEACKNYLFCHMDQNEAKRVAERYAKAVHPNAQVKSIEKSTDPIGAYDIKIIVPSDDIEIEFII